MKKTAVIVAGLLALNILLLGGCMNNSTREQTNYHPNKISVYTSIYPMYDFTKKIGGDRINLTNLVPSGTEPHDWEPAPGDIAKLEKADVLIYNGAGMEEWIDDILGSINNKNLITIETSKEISLLENAHQEQDENNHEDLKYDPHVWLNPMNAKKQMEAIKDALVKADPANKNYYENNFTENSIKLDQLDKEYKDTTASFTRKDLVVAHEAFGYLCNAYGLNQVGISGLSAESEPTPARMAEVARFARKNNVEYIFFEELVSPRVAQAIANEVGAKTEMLNPLEGLKQDDIDAGKEYFSVMRDNLATLSKALK